MIRKFFAQFNRSIAERIVASRYPYAFPIKLTFEPDKATGKLQMHRSNLYITGETKDLSQSGIAFIVPAIRLQENYLVGEERALNAELDLPLGKICMKVVGRRYEQVGEHISTARYLIGAQILQMSDEHREFYEDFLRNGNKMMNSKVLKFGIDQS